MKNTYMQEDINRTHVKAMSHPVATNAPYLVAFILMLTGFILPFVVGPIISGLLLGNRSEQVYRMGNAVFCSAVSIGLMLLFMQIFKSEFDGFFQKEGFAKGFLLSIPYMAFWVIWDSTKAAFHLIEFDSFEIGALFCGMQTGIIEEIAFRALALTILLRLHAKKNDVIAAPVIVGIAFGCVHLLNLTAGDDPEFVFLTVLFAISTGIVIGVIYTMSGNIWAVILCHGLYDTVAFLCPDDVDGPIWPNLVDIGAMVIMAAFYLWFLHAKKNETFDLWSHKWQLNTPDVEEN